MSEIEKQRDAALIGYNECRATIEDARSALGATKHEGMLLAAMRVKDERDRLAEAMQHLMTHGGHNQPVLRDTVFNVASEALGFEDGKMKNDKKDLINALIFCREKAYSIMNTKLDEWDSMVLHMADEIEDRVDETLAAVKGGPQ
jgi:hypothetical protein